MSEIFNTLKDANVICRTWAFIFYRNILCLHHDLTNVERPLNLQEWLVGANCITLYAFENISVYYGYYLF